MIRVSVLYPAGEGVTFDHDYYRTSHMPLCGRLLGPHGLIRYEIGRGVTTPVPSAPPPYVGACHFFFNTVEEYERGIAATGAELIADIPNYTNSNAVIQVSEVVE